jgi:hypothetical protein
MQALRRLTEMISSSNPTLMVKEPQNSVGAVIGVVERRDAAAAMQPDKGEAQQLI